MSLSGCVVHHFILNEIHMPRMSKPETQKKKNRTLLYRDKASFFCGHDRKNQQKPPNYYIPMYSIHTVLV